MRRRNGLRVAAFAAAAAVVTAHAAASAAPAPPLAFDYMKVPGLSQPTRGDVSTTVVRLPASDGKELYLEVTRSDDAGRVPVILEASPYHGTFNDRSGYLPEPTVKGERVGLTGFFPQRGYAVVMMDLRGTGYSQGCLDQLGPTDAKDLVTVIEWAARQPWSNGRVAMMGHSYVGSTPIVAAAQRPRGLATIVPSAGVASLYDHQFQGGVPYFLQYAGPQAGYAALSVARDLPVRVPLLGGQTTGQNFGKDPAATGCGLASSSLLAGSGQVTGQYEPWHAARDWSKGGAAAPIPVFLVHGVNDGAIRVPGASWFLHRNGRPGDKAWIGQWAHDVNRGLQLTYALLAWFDRHLKRKQVATGPPVEVFLNDAPTLAAARADEGKREVLVATRFPVAPPSFRLFPAADGTLVPTPRGAGAQTFTGDPRGHAEEPTGELRWSTAPMRSDLVVAGVPELTLTASVTVPQVHLIANLLDQAPDGALRRISQFAINPLLRDGLHKVSPVVPGAVMKLRPVPFAIAHRLAKGHRLVLQVVTSDPDKVPTTAADPRITVMTGPGGTELRLPVVRAPTRAPDTLRLR